MTRTLVLPAGLAMALALAGCGRQAAPSAAAANAAASSVVEETHPIPMPKACDVLTEAIAKKYLGDDAQLRRDAQPNPKMSQCQWGGERGIITIMVGPWNMIHGSGAAADRPASGFGDEAYEGFSGLAVRKGDKGVSINVMTEAGEFWGKAADDVEARQKAAQEKVAPDLIARL